MRRQPPKRNNREGNSDYRMTYQRRKVCRFCVDKSLTIDYKNTGILQYFVTERGKIIPRRITGNCAKHQREITRAIRQGRNVALVPYTTPIA